MLQSTLMLQSKLRNNAAKHDNSAMHDDAAKHITHANQNFDAAKNQYGMLQGSTQKTPYCCEAKSLSVHCQGCTWTSIEVHISKARYLQSNGKLYNTGS